MLWSVDGRERHGLWAEFAERLKSFGAELTACYTRGTLMYCPSDVITHAISLTPAAAAAAIIHANVGDNPSQLSARLVALSSFTKIIYMHRKPLGGIEYIHLYSPQR